MLFSQRVYDSPFLVEHEVGSGDHANSRSMSMLFAQRSHT